MEYIKAKDFELQRSAVLIITIDTQLMNFTQEVAVVILSNPMAGAKYFLPIGREVSSVISIPPGNIHEFDARFYDRHESVRLAYHLLLNGWYLEKIRMDVLQRHVIQVIEKNNIEMILILERLVKKRIENFYDYCPSYEAIPPAPFNSSELDRLKNLQILLQHKDKMCPRLLGVFEYSGEAAIEKK